MIEHNLFSLFIHLDVHIKEFIAAYHNYFYLVLFVTIFAETGFIFFPFLPGDTLLFVSGSLSNSSNLNIFFMAIIITVAAFMGDNCNYFIGRKLGSALLSKSKSKFIQKKFLLKTHDYFADYGAKTVILARLIPIIRSFAPFVAGIGQMNYISFLVFSFIGSIIWVTLFLGSGFLFGKIPFINNHLSLLMLIILLLSIMPVIKMVIHEVRK